MVYTGRVWKIFVVGPLIALILGCADDDGGVSHASSDDTSAAGSRDDELPRDADASSASSVSEADDSEDPDSDDEDAGDDDGSDDPGSDDPGSDDDDAGDDGSDDDGTIESVSSDGGEIPRSEFGPQFGAAWCEFNWRCGGLSRALLGNAEDCEANLELLFDFEHTLGDPLVEYQAGAAARCLDGILGAACDADPEAECDDVFVGTLPEGATCAQDLQCLDGFCALDEGCSGTCTALRSEGGECASSDQCGSGLACGADDTCAQPAWIGESCTEAPCGSNLSCGGSFEEPVCLGGDQFWVGELGDPCGLGQLLCKADLTCANTEDGSVCMPYAEPDGTCYSATPSMCPRGYYCERSDDQREGLCLSQLDAGSPCSDDVQCDGGNCVDQSCGVFVELRGACSDHQHCRSNNCVDGECVGAAVCKSEAKRS